jgi:hypothetical protein
VANLLPFPRFPAALPKQGDRYEAYRLAGPRTVTMLNFVFADGSIDALAYSCLRYTEHRFLGDGNGGVLILFEPAPGDWDLAVLTGRCLARLPDKIRQRAVWWIRELPEGEKWPPDQPVVHSIEIRDIDANQAEAILARGGTE